MLDLVLASHWECWVFVTGGHTGAIQATGGAGQLGSGRGASGSGAGGRVALYHSTVDQHPPYRGRYDTQGGAVGTNAEAGASGTVFIHHETTNRKTLRVDNRGRAPKVGGI